MARINPKDIAAAAIETMNSDSDALFISCTALRSAEVAANIEKQIASPVITSNQSGICMTLRTAGVADRIKGFGRIFDYDLPLETGK